MSRALAMSTCLSRPGDARMPRALAMSACLSRPGDARMPRALAMSACLSRPGDVHMPRALAMPACLVPGDVHMPRALAMSACLAPWRSSERDAYVAEKCAFGQKLQQQRAHSALLDYQLLTKETNDVVASDCSSGDLVWRTTIFSQMRQRIGSFTAIGESLLENLFGLLDDAVCGTLVEFRTGKRRLTQQRRQLLCLGLELDAEGSGLVDGFGDLVPQMDGFGQYLLDYVSHRSNMNMKIKMKRI
ncbi:hypothetical protein VNO80_19331 [Phaseolus coccineus]|uniref:Uncharacterized protein n=1 Tax=Phaseolus coccineus TaxID=3886 RepID=A0AAN9MKP7_PHACN